MRENKKDTGPKIVKYKELIIFKKISVYVFTFLLISFLSVRSYSVEPYDAVYKNGLLTIPKILVPSHQDIFRVEMELESGAQALALGCSEYCFRLVNAESSSVKSPPFFPNFDGVFANINRLWVDDQLYEISLKLLGEMSGQIYFGLHFADHPKPFQSTPLVLSDEIARPYYNHACQLEQKARKLPNMQFAIPVDINQDDYLDFIVHYYCALDDPYYGELQEHQTPDILVAFVSDSVGNYRVQNELVFGELYPALGGASRKYVVGDINQDGVDDFAFSMNWEDGRPGGDDRRNMSIAAYPAVVLSQSKGRYQVYRLGERSWGHSVGLVPNATGGFDAVFAGAWGKNLQAFRYVQDTFQNVTDEYPPPNMNPGWAGAFRALLPGTDNYSFGRQIVSNLAYSPNLDVGLTLWRETASGWEISSEFLIKAGSKISGITWTKDPTEWAIQELNGKEYVQGDFAEMCVMENFDLTGETYIVGKFSAARFAEPVDYSRVYDEGDLLPAQVMVFFQVVDGKLVLSGSSIIGEIENVNANYFSCKDFNNDGYADLVVEVLDQAWVSSQYDLGGVPFIYLNDKQGNLVKMGTEVFPSLRTGQAQGHLADVNRDGLPDLVLFPQSVRKDENFAPGTNNDLLIYLSRKIIGE